MKNIRNLFLIALIFLVASCSKDENSYQISGKLKNGSNQTLYLLEMQDNGFKPLDTIDLSDNGKFSITENFGEPSIFILQATNDYITFCPSGGENIEINGDYKDLSGTYTIKGSKESEKLKILNEQQVYTRKQLKDMFDQLNMMNIEDADSVRAIVTEQFQILREQQKTFLTKFIEDNQGSLTSLVALYRQFENRPFFDLNRDFDMFDKVLKGLKKAYPNNSNTKNLEALVNNFKQLQQNNTQPQNQPLTDATKK